MSNTVVVVFAVKVEPQEILGLVEEVGGGIDPAIPDSPFLERGDDIVWLYGQENEEIGDDPESDAKYELALGGPWRAFVMLQLSRSAGSPRLAMDFVEAAAQHWRLIVDNERDEILTVDQLRDRAEHFSSIFWEVNWHWR